MKKILTILLTLLMVFTLVGCNSESKEEQPAVDAIQEEVVKEPVEEEPEQLVGGWTDAVDSSITDELKDIFNKGLEGILGATYKPTKLLATQVVNGINYKFLAEGEKTTNPPVKGIYNITINKSSDGTISLLDIEVVEEELPEQKQAKDVTQMSFWVVFYDQYGNELQREALKYGSTPSYKKDLPEGFEKWVYKKTQKDVGTLKAITGNTYYQAICHAVSRKSSDSTPVSTEVNYLYFKNVGTTQTSIKIASTPKPAEDPLEFVYSKDKTNWNNVIINEPLSISNNETIYIKAKTHNPYMIDFQPGYDWYKGVGFKSDNTSSLEIGGSIMTLLDPTDTLRDISGRGHCFAYLFADMDNIVEAKKLVMPATKLAPYCYFAMFNDDNGLKHVNPNLLPATDLSVGVSPEGNGCYNYMFYGCNSLIEAPILPAAILQKNCYKDMFNGCSSLNSITMLVTDIAAEGCLDDWVKGIAVTGTFTRNESKPSLPSGNSGVPAGWTLLPAD